MFDTIINYFFMNNQNSSDSNKPGAICIKSKTCYVASDVSFKFCFTKPSEGKPAAVTDLKTKTNKQTKTWIQTKLHIQINPVSCFLIFSVYLNECRSMSTAQTVFIYIKNRYIYNLI